MRREVTISQVGQQAFFLVGDDFLLEQRQEAVGDHMRVQAEVFLAVQILQQMEGQVAEPDLEGRPVIHEL